jgi:hypothetical protein
MSIYKKDDLFALYEYFYKTVDEIIYKIHNNITINTNLFYCNYNLLNNNSKLILPLTICLGGGGYLLYKKIFEKEGLKYENNIITYDYDLSFSIYKYIEIVKLNAIENELIKICNQCLKEFKYMNLNKNIFSFDCKINKQRLHFRIICDTKINNIFHILELSFWLNGKISDNFSINDFYNRSLILYHNIDYYYLLPLDLLVKTTLYAIVDFFEKRNFSKCIKYLDRLKFIKKINDKYMKLENNSNILFLLLDTYGEKIKRKYKMIHDYPYIIAYDIGNIKNNGIIKCIYRYLRKNNKEKITEIIRKYKNKCKDKKEYINSEITLIDTEINTPSKKKYIKLYY